MKKLCSIVLILLVCFALFSCSNLYQDYSTAASTTVLIPAESICRARNALSTSDLYISVCLEMDGSKRIIEQNKKISDEYATKGMTFTFEKLPVGKNGTISVAVGTDQTFSDNFSVKKISTLDGESRFTVKKKNNLIKVEISTSTVYHGEFETFSEIDESYKRVTITFTESSTINAPLPVGTTKWAISHNGNLYGRFGEIIDVKNQLMNYKTYFPEQEYEQQVPINFVPTGESPENIKTPIVYCEKGSNEEVVSFTYKILGSNTPVLPTPSETKDYCFDNAGNFYYVTSDGVFKIAYNHKENKYEDFENQGIFNNREDVQLSYDNAQISYDKAQNYLYVYGSNEIENKYLTRIQNPAGAIYKNTIVGTIGDSWSTDPLEREFNDIADPSFTVHDGILYVSKIQNAPDDSGTKYSYSLVLQKGSIETGIFEDTAIEYKILSDAQNGLSGNTDIMYQDGSLYIIFSCSNNNWASTSENYSTGGIVKYDTESGQFDKSFGIKGFAQRKTLTGSEGATLNFYAPTSGNNGTESKYFYGPKQFVAIMPKKLVFLDSGADVSSYDASLYPNNPSKIPSKSRIVEYDLSTNSFSSTEITGTDLGFGFSGFTM